YLGAAHSPEPTSVMRPLLGDGKGNSRYFRAPYDPVNTLVMNLVAEELRGRPLRNLAELSSSTKERLAQVYAEMAKTQPDDPTPPKYLRLLGNSVVASATEQRPSVLAENTEKI